MLTALRAPRFLQNLKAMLLPMMLVLFQVVAFHHSAFEWLPATLYRKLLDLLKLRQWLQF